MLLFEVYVGDVMDVRYNIILLGEVGVGKTSLFNRIRTGKFQETEESTLRDEYFENLMTVEGDQISVTLWDTGDCEKFRSLTADFFEKANGAILVYCVEDGYTFENLQKWIDEASKHVPTESFVWAVFGSKSDLPNEVEQIKIEALCDQLKTKLFHLVSAKTGENVMEAFRDVVITIHNTCHRHPQPNNCTKAKIDGARTTRPNSCCTLC